MHQSGIACAIACPISIPSRSTTFKWPHIPTVANGASGALRWLPEHINKVCAFLKEWG